MQRVLVDSIHRGRRPRRTSGLISLGTAACVLTILALSGCPTSSPNGDDNVNGNDNGGTDGDTGVLGGKIISFSTFFSMSELDPAVSVLYEVTGGPDSIAGFYVPVADANPAAGETGDRVVAATSLPSTGPNRRFQFDPRVAGVGYFKVGILLERGDETAEALSTGVVQVEGQPSPRFIRPVAAFDEVLQGTEVPVAFDAGDPEGDVQWRLFYLSESDSQNNLPDELGTLLAAGRGNVGGATFSTAGLGSGDYQLGLSATDSGSSVSATVASGNLDRIITVFGPIVRVVAQSEIQPPTFRFTAPGNNDVALFRNEAFTIQFSTTINEPGAKALIELFYDSDNRITNGFANTIAQNLDETRTSFPLPTSDIPEGTWCIGATVITVGGISAPITLYASGSIEIVRNPTLTVTEPDSSLPVPPSTPVSIVWATNAPESAGTVSVFVRTLGTGESATLLSSVPLTQTSTVFQEETSGLYEVTVRLDFIDATHLEKQAGALIRVSSLPRILWLGSLIDPDPPFDGAIFGGVNFEDNAGSALSEAGDLDGDGHGDFVIAARYGKPFFRNPSGIGQGEAYVIYGGSGAGRLAGEYNLNSVGTETLRGIALPGIPTVDNTDETYGLDGVTLIPDVDGDGHGELLFGFPFVDSAGGNVGPLEADGQFRQGGVVMLSSNNSLLADPPITDAVIHLSAVGQTFSEMTVTPSAANLAVFDAWRFEGTQCVNGTDGVVDTIHGPCIGFVSLLAPPLWEQVGFEIYTGPESEGLCRTFYNLVGCNQSPDPFFESDAGSGFYPSAAVALEPRGARIIGQGDGERFGMAVTATTSPDDGDPGDLIISAPERNASSAFIEGLTGTLSDAGVAYLVDNRSLWSRVGNEVPPAPYQYVMGVTSHCGDNRSGGLQDAIRIAGAERDNIQNVIGVGDFNGDGRNDFAVGAPGAGGGQGRVYVAYRRDEAIEGDFLLSKLELDPGNAERLAGMLIVRSSAAALGFSLASRVDFNGDDIDDLVIGAPNASGGIGEVILVFGNSGVVSPLGGISIDSLLATRTVDNRPVAARITGNLRDAKGLLGFNVANAGDLDGDGGDDLLIAAPGASPRFDPTPSDAADALTEPGLDLDFDGVRDDLFGVDDELPAAGIVYVILSQNRLDQIRTCDSDGRACVTDADCDTDDVCTSTSMTINIDQLGTSQLRGFMIVGRNPGDQIGGGDAGDTTAGGLDVKNGRGRSRGLSPAGDVDGDGRGDILIGSVVADPRINPSTGKGVRNGGEAYLVYGTAAP